jgi:cytochrome c oxidase cbb3-type subunit 3
MDEDKLLEHDYDGIQEYDNDLPRWWLNIFWLTAIYAVGYIVYMHGFAETPEEQLKQQLAELEAMKPEEESVAEGVSLEDKLLALVDDQSVVANGQALYAQKCAACHGQQGQGLVGPNLTDAYWIHGGSLSEIKHIIVEGVPSKGMLSWKTMMTNEEINSVVAYIWTLKGTNPPNPKAPEGELVE